MRPTEAADNLMTPEDSVRLREILERVVVDHMGWRHAYPGKGRGWIFRESSRVTVYDTDTRRYNMPWAEVQARSILTAHDVGGDDAVERYLRVTMTVDNTARLVSP